MPYGLNGNLSYCVIDGHPIFLDLERDCYFRLTEAMEQAFLRHTGVRRTEAGRLYDLVARRILVPTDKVSLNLAPAYAVPPAKSAMERDSAEPPVNLRAIPEVSCIVLSTWFRLKRRPLRQNLESMAAYRECRAVRNSPGALSETTDARLCDASTLFSTARLYVPVDTCCLPDSISLIKFLARRGLHADLVFGIMTNPLSAHCWVQAGNLILNDTVGNASSHAPIRVI